MSTIIIAAILIAITIVVPMIFISINKKNARKQNEENFKLFSLSGSNQGLSFSNHQILKNKIIGLDSLQQKLLVYEFIDANVICISMKEVSNCTVNKEFESTDMGTDKKAKMEKRLKSIDLKFSFKRNTEPTSISFYDSGVNNIFEMAELEAKAKEWETELSKMIVKQPKAIA
jgi:hypothetical protein